jgi:SAM-dependent methyltransferase
MSVPHPIPVASAGPRRLTHVLQKAGYTFDAVKARLGTQYRQWLPRETGITGQLLTFLQAVRMYADIGTRMLSPVSSGILGSISNYFKNRGPRDSLDVLIWLFLLNEPVKTTSLRTIFVPKDIDALASMNLIRLEGPYAICDLALFECAGLFLVTDAMARPAADVNRVMALIPESFDFVSYTSRKPVDSVLDLCTGSGVHALVATRHAQYVVASDINNRALRFAEFNAWFNDITNIEFCYGDLFRAVEGRAFDLILANPPYMPDAESYPNENFYCGGKSGDVLWSQILRGLEEHLRPGGLCQIIHMITLFDNESCEDKIRALLGPLADFCDILFCSNPITFRNEHMAGATSVDFGVTSIKRRAKPGGVFCVRVPFRPPLPFDVADLLIALEQTACAEERMLVCKRQFARSRQNRRLRGTTLIGSVSFALYCALLLRSALRSSWVNGGLGVHFPPKRNRSAC